MEYPIDALMDRYCFYRRKYVIMRGEMTRHLDAKFTRKQVWEHFQGLISLCVFSGPVMTSFLSIDIDYPDPAVVHGVVDTMTVLGIPRDRIYVSLSGGKGYHVDIFFAENTFNWRAKVLYDLIIYFGGFDRRKVEYRPNETQSIKLPLGIHQKTGRRCWFVDRETLKPIEDFRYIETTEKIPGQVIDRVLKDGNKRRFEQLIREIDEEHEAAPQRPPKGDLNGYDIVEPGTRHKMMIRVALKLYRDGGDYQSIHRGLTDWYLRQNMDLISSPYSECMRDIDDITGWVMQKGRRRELGDDPTHDYHLNTRIFASDARRIIQGGTKNARMMAFLFTVYCDKYGFCGMGEWSLCKILGISSNKTVVAAANDLTGKKLFQKTKGGFRFAGEAYRKVTNKYKFPQDYEREGEHIEIDGLVTEDNIYELYIRTIVALCDPAELEARLTRNELEDCRKLESTDS